MLRLLVSLNALALAVVLKVGMKLALLFHLHHGTVPLNHPFPEIINFANIEHFHNSD